MIQELLLHRDYKYLNTVTIPGEPIGELYPLLVTACDYGFRKWQNIHSIVGVVFDPVHDVAFAPNLGRCVMAGGCLSYYHCLHCRSYHMLAVASKDVDIIHLSPSGYGILRCTLKIIN